MADWYVATTGSDSTGTGSSGSPYATPGKGASAMSGGDRLLIKGGTYTQTSASANVAGGYVNPPTGTAVAPTQVIGYSATVGDLDEVAVPSSGNTSGGLTFPWIKSFSGGASTVFRLANQFTIGRNLVLDGLTFAQYACYIIGGDNQAVNCSGANTSLYAFYTAAIRTSVIRCFGTGCTYGLYCASGSQSLFLYSVATANTSGGVKCESGASLTCERCISYANTGANVHGFSDFNSGRAAFIGCVSYGNGGDGIRFSGAYASIFGTVRNCILVGNGGYGVNSDTTNIPVLLSDYNFYYNNTSGDRHNVPTESTYVDLSGVPFTNAGSGDFSLNNTAGQGAAIRAAGFPGTFPGGLTVGYLDGGAVQHQDSGGAGTIFVETNCPVIGTSWRAIGY